MPLTLEILKIQILFLNLGLEQKINVTKTGTGAACDRYQPAVKRKQQF